MNTFCVGRAKVLRGQAPAGFQRDGVVPGVDVAAVNQHAVARIHVYPIAIGPHGADDEVAGGELAAEQDMDGPKLLVLRGEVIQQDVGAAGQFDQHRAARTAQLAEGQRRTKNRPPSDGDVRRVAGGDQRPVARPEFALPAHVFKRIIGDVRAADQTGARRQFQRGVGVRYEAAGQIHPVRQHHGTPAGFAAGVQRLLNGGGVLRHPVALGAEIGHVQPWPIRRAPAGGQSRQHNGQCNPFFHLLTCSLQMSPGGVNPPCALPPSPILARLTRIE